MGHAPTDVVHARGQSGSRVDVDRGHHGIGAYFTSVGQGIGNVGDQGRGFRVDLAPLQAESAVDAVGPVAEAAVGDRHRSYFGGNPSRQGAALKEFAVPGDWMGAVGVAVRLTPGPVLPSHRQFLLNVLIVAPKVLVLQGPVCSHPV